MLIDVYVPNQNLEKTLWPRPCRFELWDWTLKHQQKSLCCYCSQITARFLFTSAFPCETEMENVHLAVEEEDLYSGYNDYNPTFDSEVSKTPTLSCVDGIFRSVLKLLHCATYVAVQLHDLKIVNWYIIIYNHTYCGLFKELENDVGFQQAVRTSHGRRPPVRTDCSWAKMYNSHVMNHKV